MNVVYLMVGLPGAGKSTTSRQLAGDNGVVCETDAFFRDQPDIPFIVAGDPLWSRSRSRRWYREQFMRAVSGGRSPIVVDRGNGLDRETYFYARYAVTHGYQVELAEPTTEWWTEVKGLLESPEEHAPLDAAMEIKSERFHDSVVL